ncbi:unnamed protein product, partial [marine sediment metagenome]
ELKQNLADAHHNIEVHASTILGLQHERLQFENTIYGLERTIKDLEWDKRELQDNNSRLANEIHTKDQEIYNLQTTNRDLQHKVDTANSAFISALV